MYVLVETHARYEKMMSHTVVIYSVGAPFHFAAFHCDLRTELALLYFILLHQCLPVFVSIIERVYLLLTLIFTCIPKIQVILLVMGVVILSISL